MNEFIADNNGKCCVCEESKPLDSMVRHYGEKGTYHCIDCETSIYLRQAAADFVTDEKNIDDAINNPEKRKKLKQLIRWCIG